MENVNTKFTLEIPGLYLYRAKVINVVDGDTVDVFIDKGTDDYKTIRIRLKGINAPEIHNVKHGSEAHKKGMASKKALEEKILGKEVMIKTFKDKKGKYGRYIGVIDVPTGPKAMSYVNINHWMTSKGYAVVKEY